MLRHKPGIFLAAETGGKNATIVTAMADRDQAIKNVLYSAFRQQRPEVLGHLPADPGKGGLCRPETFKRQLVDAARSFATGSAWIFENRMGPLIRPPGGDLERALTTLEPGEDPGPWNPATCRTTPISGHPGIKWGVQPGSYTHMTEFFGPLLGVMRGRQPGPRHRAGQPTGYGLTSGIESLDRREQALEGSGIRAGNLYINRGTTGAITLRQPFGGMGKSALGPAVKAGVTQLRLPVHDV
jgi:RHH-type proline utilization regulon transcriptional repressor/proline dehydrogenase/delta 1-pyrroline-5-carboxylate dehydrogenase